jgi:TolB protein
VFTTKRDGSDRRLVAGGEGHLYFGPSWSHDGEWLLYVDCQLSGGPGHDWADLCIGRPDGSQHRVVTQGQRHWFGTSYGGPKTRGSGSNIPQWSPQQLVCTYTRALPDSRTAWQYVEDRPDTDHFNRDYRPDLARGGTEICLLQPLSGELTRLTHVEPPVWDFRTAWSRDAARLAFCRAAMGEASELWVMDADGGRAMPLTRGYEGQGADHPAWIG